MEKSKDKEPISISWASKKGATPKIHTLEASRRNWSKRYFYRGKLLGKRVQKKRKLWTREVEE